MEIRCRNPRCNHWFQLNRHIFSDGSIILWYLDTPRSYRGNVENPFTNLVASGKIFAEKIIPIQERNDRSEENPPNLNFDKVIKKGLTEYHIICTLMWRSSLKYNHEKELEKLQKRCENLIISSLKNL